MVFLIQQTMLYAVPLMIVALAGVCAERSGVINLALEGIMIFGAFMGVIFIRMFQGMGFVQEQGQIVMLISMLLTGICGIAFSMLLAFSAINLRADQTIGGTALNLLSTAIALVVVKRYNGTQSAKLSYDNSPFIFQVGPLTLNVFLIIGLVLLVVLKRSKALEKLA